MDSFICLFICPAAIFDAVIVFNVFFDYIRQVLLCHFSIFHVTPSLKMTVNLSSVSADNRPPQAHRNKHAALRAEMRSGKRKETRCASSPPRRSGQSPSRLLRETLFFLRKPETISFFWQDKRKKRCQKRPFSSNSRACAVKCRNALGIASVSNSAAFTQRKSAASPVTSAR